MVLTEKQKVDTMNLRERDFNKALKNISDLMPQIRYYFNEAAIHCECLRSNYKELKNLDMESYEFDTLWGKTTQEHVEFLEIAWGLADNIGRIEQKLNSVVGGLDVMENIFNGSHETTYIMGEIMMCFMEASNTEDQRKMNKLAKKLRATLARIEVFVAENINQKGETK